MSFRLAQFPQGCCKPWLPIPPSQRPQGRAWAARIHDKIQALSLVLSRWHHVYIMHACAGSIGVLQAMAPDPAFPKGARAEHGQQAQDLAQVGRLILRLACAGAAPALELVAQRLPPDLVQVHIVLACALPGCLHVLLLGARPGRYHSPAWLAMTRPLLWSWWLKHCPQTLLQCLSARHEEILGV